MKQLKQLVVGGRQETGDFLAGQVGRCANALAALGCEPGERVAVLLRNSLEQLTVTLAAQRIGAYPVQLNWHGQGAELHYVLQDCGARVLVAHDDLLARLGRDRLGPLRIVTVVPDPALRAAYRIDTGRAAPPPDAIAWDGWLAAQEPVTAAPLPTPDSIIYTSGTTGQPKGVRRFAPTPAQAQRTEKMRSTVTGLAAASRAMVPAPLYHSAPLMFALRAARSAELLCVPPRFDALEFLREVERLRITHVYVVPTILVRLLALPAQLRARHDLSSLQFVLHAGGPCPSTVKRAMIDWLGPIMYEYYGSTEAGPNTFCTSQDALRKPGTVGRAIDDVAIEILDEQGAPVGAGVVGEICVRNDAYPDFTYLHRAADRAALQRGDLLATGDLGYRDAEGYYYVCDRKRDMVISGGVNIYPAEIEAAIMELPQVADCAVFGIPDEEFGEALAALVQPHEGQVLDGPTVGMHLRQRLAAFKLPRLIELRESLPRDESGKIRKRVLRDAYWVDVGRRI